MDPIFRPAAPKDVAEISNGLKLSFVPMLEEFYKNGFYTYFTNEAWIKERIDNDFVYVCTAGSKVVGAIILCKEKEADTLKLHTVYVDNAYRRKGLATFMILSCEAIHADTKHWVLETVEALKGNTDLYEKLGYAQWGKPKLVNDRVTIVYYEKQT